MPAPVKLESLQVLTAMSRNYFATLMAPFMIFITKALDNCLSDKYSDLRLHAGRTVDFIGQAMNTYLSNNGKCYVKILFLQCCQNGDFLWCHFAN